MITQNDVMDFSKYYFGKKEPLPFNHEYFDLEDKTFIPVDDFKIAEKLSLQSKKDVILHHFVKDTKQNRLLRNYCVDKDLHSKVYAVTSPDFSVDCKKSYSCFNEGNILKSRICAYQWQSECDERVILTLQWGDESTYKWAFENIEKGSIVAVSSQGIEDLEIFKNGLIYGIEKIEPDYICWYGSIPEYLHTYYDLHRIIKMQTRTQLLNMKENKLSNDLF